MENSFRVLTTKDLWTIVRKYMKPIYCEQYRTNSSDNSCIITQELIFYYDGDKGLYFILATQEINKDVIISYGLYKITKCDTQDKLSFKFERGDNVFEMYIFAYATKCIEKRINYHHSYYDDGTSISRPISIFEFHKKINRVNQCINNKICIPVLIQRMDENENKKKLLECMSLIYGENLTLKNTSINIQFDVDTQLKLTMKFDPTVQTKLCSMYINI